MHQVRYFVALAANARRRGVAQPTLTIGTKALERKLGGRGDLHSKPDRTIVGGGANGQLRPGNAPGLLRGVRDPFGSPSNYNLRRGLSACPATSPDLRFVVRGCGTPLQFGETPF